MSRPLEGIDGMTRAIGLRWETAERTRITLGEEHLNPSGLLSGAVTYAMVDYTMGSALWTKRESGERIATIGISVNYVRTAREGEVVCTARVDRRNDRIAVLSAEVTTADGSLIATAIGSYSIFPADRLGEHDRGPMRPGPDAAGDPGGSDAPDPV